jgi:hypothetical protein
MTPGSKYLKGRAYDGDRMCPWVIWDGVRAYRNSPPPGLLQTENLNGRIVIAQIKSRTAGIETIDAILKAGAESVVLWARDHKTYRAIVQNVKRQSDGWLT